MFTRGFEKIASFMPNVNKVATKTVAQMSAAVARKKPLTAAMARGGLK